MIKLKPKLFLIFILGYFSIFGPDFKIIDLQFFTCLFLAITGIIYFFLKKSFNNIYIYFFFLLCFVVIFHLSIWPNGLFGLETFIKFTVFYLQQYSTFNYYIYITITIHR